MARRRSGSTVPSDGSFHLTDGHDGTTEVAFVYGPPNMVPIAGDWNNA